MWRVLRGTSSLLLLLLADLSSARAQNNDVTNEWRITGYPHYPIKGNLTGYGYLEWAKNPQANYSRWYGGYPGFIYNARPHIRLARNSHHPASVPNAATAPSPRPA